MVSKCIQVNTQIDRKSRKGSLTDRKETFRRRAESVSGRDPSEERREERQPSLGENGDV